eukprot:scaffold1007_cov176-Amphora_coffeaeformis.AAC.8
MESEEEEYANIAPVTNQAFCAWNFAPDGGEETYKCRNCQRSGIRQLPGGYTNLMKHCQNSSCYGIKYRKKGHPKYAAAMSRIWRAYWAAHSQENTGIRSVFKSLNSPKAKKVFGWIELVVKCNMPLSACENDVIRRHVKMEGMSRKTLRQNIIKLADIVGLVIKQTIGPGNCMADGWSSAGVHYFAIVHRWPYMTSGGHIQVKEALLSCQPLISEVTLDAENTAESIKATYELYGNFEDLVVCFTMDNTNVNPAVTRLCERPMIGAYCHRLNLASRVWLEEAFQGDLMVFLEVIHAIMKRASTLKGRGALKLHTPYCPELANKTRWTSLHSMAVKFVAMHKALEFSKLYKSVKDDEMEEIEVQNARGNSRTPISKRVKPVLLSTDDFSRFKYDMVPAIKKLKLWFDAIQTADIDLAAARGAFLMAKNHSLLVGHSVEYEERLDPTHRLVVSPHFESGVEKIINESTETLTEAEKQACKVLLRTNWKHLYPKNTSKEAAERANSVDDDPNSPTKFLKRLNETREKSTNSLQSVYLTNLSWISPTTVVVERLFSRCKRVMTADRRRMHPRIFEAIVFLKKNEDFWNIKLVQEMVSGKWDEALGSTYDSDSDSNDSSSVNSADDKW